MNKEEKEKSMPQGALLESWIKASTDFWKSTASTWPATFGGISPVQGETGKEGGDKSDEDSWKMFSEIWQALFNLINKPVTGEFHPVSSLPERILKASQPLWSGSLLFQKQWMEGEVKVPVGELEGFANLSQKMTKALLEMYEKEFGQILNMPQLGLTRAYQERANQTIEKFIQFQGGLTEFMQFLLIPMEKAYNAVQEEIKNAEKQGKEALKDSKAYYQFWIKNMEANYMVLLKSTEYTEKLGETMKALHDFRIAKSQLFMDILQDLPIPTNRDMDELYKDLYLLKKRIKELEKKVKSYER
jgi:class III poly(R)-hydroxyalkanoic acid synthase PhaE subunit